MALKKIILASVIGFSINFSISSFATDLTTTNCTKFPSTTITNNGACSNILPGGVGVTPPDCKPHTVPESAIKLACLANRNNCKADVYMSSNCTGAKIATIIFDVSKGVKSISMIDQSYSIAANNFTVAISGGPTLASK